jgi:hypothetical protein
MNYRDELLDGDLEFDPEVAGACCGGLASPLTAMIVGVVDAVSFCVTVCGQLSSSS